MAPTPQANVVSLKKELSSAVTAARVEDIIAILTQLKKDVVVSEELIRVTKIGITVNSLRKNENKAVSELAKEIIKKWKSDVGAAKPAKATAESATPSLVLPTPSPGPNSPSLTRKPEPTPPSEPPTPVASSSTTPAPLRPAAAERRFSLNGATRTHKTDAVTFNEPSFLGDKTRSKCLELLYDALALDSDAPTELIYKQAKAVELHVHEANDTAAYRVKIRSLFQNLKDKSNPSLRENVVSGEISATKLCTMTPAEMASEELQAENRKLVELNLFKAQGAAPQQAETDAFQCGKCKQRRTMYYQMQTRSADEPMTTFVTCLECNNRWKFS